MAQTIKKMVEKEKKVSINVLTEYELTTLKTALNDFKYDLGIFADYEYNSAYKKKDSARIISVLTKILFRRGLLPEKMEIDFKYIIEQLKA